MRLSFIWVVLYIFSEAIANECSTSHMTPHIYWFPWMRTGSRHGPWNSPPLYLGETIGVSARLDSAIGTGFYKLLSVFAILYTKFYMPTLINHRNNSKTAPISLYFVRVSSWGSLPQDTCLFYILTSFVHVGPLDMLTTGAVPLAVNCERVSRGDSVAFHPQTWSPEYQAENTLQSDNPTSYFINAYIFMAKTTFNRLSLPSICVVIWIYLFHHGA